MERMFVSQWTIRAIASLPSTHFSAARKNSTHGTLWRLCARIARRVESCSKNNSLAYDVRASRLVSSSRVASRPLAGQMTGTHVFPHWRMALIFVCVFRRSCQWEGERVNTREEGKEEETEGARNGHVACLVLFRDSLSLFPFRRIPALSDIFLLPFCFFFFSPDLT